MPSDLRFVSSLSPSASGVVASHAFDIPVDLVKIANELGIPVVYDATLGENSGKIARWPGAASGFRISINPRDNQRRQRFTLAHEIAHYVLHRDLIGDGITDDAMYRSPLGGEYEAQANRYAAQILLPTPSVRAEFRTNPSIAALAKRFDVSYDAMKIRLTELGL